MPQPRVPPVLTLPLPVDVSRGPEAPRFGDTQTQTGRPCQTGYSLNGSGGRVTACVDVTAVFGVRGRGCIHGGRDLACRPSAVCRSRYFASDLGGVYPLFFRPLSLVVHLLASSYRLSGSLFLPQLQPHSHTLCRYFSCALLVLRFARSLSFDLSVLSLSLFFALFFPIPAPIPFPLCRFLLLLRSLTPFVPFVRRRRWNIIRHSWIGPSHNL